jgi:hypothetical protein
MTPENDFMDLHRHIEEHIAQEIYEQLDVNLLDQLERFEIPSQMEIPSQIYIQLNQFIETLDSYFFWEGLGDGPNLIPTLTPSCPRCGGGPRWVSPDPDDDNLDATDDSDLWFCKLCEAEWRTNTG